MKRRCAKAALAYVPEEGVIGLGGGETIGYLAEEIKNAGKNVKIVTPSPTTRVLCQNLNLQVEDTKNMSEITVAFDGCDQVTKELNALKSNGGIHTAEKIIAAMAEEYILLVDENKVVDSFDGSVPIVLDVVEEAEAYLMKYLEEAGYECRVRNNTLLEVYLSKENSFEKSAEKMKALPGVIETSFFDGLAKKALVVTKEGQYVIEHP